MIAVVIILVVFVVFSAVSIIRSAYRDDEDDFGHHNID